MRDLYANVSARILAELERGAAPWVKPWSHTPGQNVPQNAITNRPYSGCNVVLLWMAQAAGYRTPRFLTFNQALELGGNVRKGEHGTIAFLSAEFSIDGDLRHAGYIQSWIGLLKADSRAFLTACSRAQAAADYLRGLALRHGQSEMAA